MSASLLAKIRWDEIVPLPAYEAPTIHAVQHLSSYNWIESASETPTISVPGSPSLWTPPSTSRRVPKDSGLSYIDQNAARHPESPLEPLFRALDISNPSFDIRSAQVVTDRNNISKLLSFVGSRKFIEEGGDGSFKIGLEVVKDTVFFERRAEATTRVIGPDDFRGFGQEFKNVYTTKKIRNTTGHHRVISYSLGPLQFVIRHEADAFVGSTLPGSAGGDDIINSFSALSLALIPKERAAPGSTLFVKREGKMIPLESTMRIKTRVSHRILDFNDVAAQFWVSQTPNLVRAYYTKGEFSTPPVEDVSKDILKWEHDNRLDLARLVALIKKIVEVVKAGCGDGGSAILQYTADGEEELTITKVASKKMLPEDLYIKWDAEPAPKGAVTQASQSLDRGIEGQEGEEGEDAILKRHKELPSLTSLPTTIRSIMLDLRSGKFNYDEDSFYRTRPDKRAARDAAFRLTYIFLDPESTFASTPQGKAEAYNAVLFIMSHPGSFKYKTKKIVNEAYRERVYPTPKQSASLAQWPLKVPIDGISDGDCTTDDGDYYCAYDSDWGN